MTTRYMHLALLSLTTCSMLFAGPQPSEHMTQLIEQKEAEQKITLQSLDPKILEQLKQEVIKEVKADLAKEKNKDESGQAHNQSLLDQAKSALGNPLSFRSPSGNALLFSIVSKTSNNSKKDSAKAVATNIATNLAFNLGPACGLSAEQKGALAFSLNNSKKRKLKTGLVFAITSSLLNAIEKALQKSPLKPYMDKIEFDTTERATSDAIKNWIALGITHPKGAIKVITKITGEDPSPTAKNVINLFKWIAELHKKI